MKRYSNTKKFLLWFFILLLILFILVIAWRSFKRSADMRPRPPQREQPNNQQPELELEADDHITISLDELVEQTHFGWPASPYQVLEILEYKAFTLAYNEQHEQANWVTYHLVHQGEMSRHERQDRFIADNRVSTASASPNDYSNSGYDRGHLAPAADFATDREALKETFYMTNMSPQVPAFNRGIWSKLENQLRAWAQDHKDLWVVTGPVLLNEKNLEQIGSNKVSVPRYYYKVVLDAREPGIKMIGFLLKNEGSSLPLSHFVVAVDSIESMTGLDFFPMLPDELEERLESSSSWKEWQLN